MNLRKQGEVKMNVLEYVAKAAHKEGDVKDKDLPRTMEIFSFLAECEYIENCSEVNEEIHSETDHHVYYQRVVLIDGVYIRYFYGTPKDNSEMDFDMNCLHYVKPETVTKVYYAATDVPFYNEILSEGIRNETDN